MVADAGGVGDTSLLITGLTETSLESTLSDAEFATMRSGDGGLVGFDEGGAVGGRVGGEVGLLVGFDD